PLRAHAQQHLLGDDAPARARVADEEDLPARRRAHSPPEKTSPRLSGAVMPFATSSLIRLPSAAGSQVCFSPRMRVAECQPRIGQTLAPPTRNTCPFTAAASSLESQATSGETLRG